MHGPLNVKLVLFPYSIFVTCSSFEDVFTTRHTAIRNRIFSTFTPPVHDPTPARFRFYSQPEKARRRGVVFLKCFRLSSNVIFRVEYRIEKKKKPRQVSQIQLAVFFFKVIC